MSDTNTHISSLYNQDIHRGFTHHFLMNSNMVMVSFELNNSNDTCSSTLLWNQSTINTQRRALYICIVATITHSVFWLQLILCSSVRQKTMQWLYAYLVTDILILLRFFFSFIVHTTSYECVNSRAWFLFVCYTEAVIDNYLNVLEVYILLALNICRYAQIAHNKNVYVTNLRLVTLAHLAIYLMPLISFIVQIPIGWAQVVEYARESCDVAYTNVYSETFNAIIAFCLPISLNIFVISVSIRHVHLTSQLRRAQHHVSAREKYHRSLVIQFLIFYTVWLSLWSPNIIVYQFTSGASTATVIASLLNYIEITLDPIIIGALNVRFYRAWKKTCIDLKNKSLRKFQPEQRRIGPATIGTTLQTIQQKRTTRL